MKNVIHAACPHDCPDACGVLITVQDGRATRIQGDPAHPVTRGFLCAKVAKYLDRVYSPDRVLYPMKRVGPKGVSDRSVRPTQAFEKGLSDRNVRPTRALETGLSDKNVRATQALETGLSDKSVRPTRAFERISWDEALGEITRRFKQISAEFGPEAILPYSYGGTLAALNGGSMDRRFFHRLGASQLYRAICDKAGDAGMRSVTGVKLGTEPEQFAHSKYIIAWAANIHGNNVHLWPFIEDARRKGAKLVVIDPYRTRTAACADWYLPINPGTDVALALGMMHVIINENLYDADYVASYTSGFEQLRTKVQQYPPQQVAEWTGIKADDIVKLAREYATVRPAVIRLNFGVQRSENGGMATRAITMLPCITGSWQEVGGGLQLSTSAAFDLNSDGLKMPELMQKALGREARTINMVELGRALNEVNDPPVKALFVYNSNPAAVCPNHNDVVRGLLRDDLFTVVHEQFFTDTTDYADIVLPATTFFEHKDLQTAYGHYYAQISTQAIEPLGECRSNVDLFRALAERMGFNDDCFRESVDQMIQTALSSGSPRLKGITRERLETENQIRLNLGVTDGSREDQFSDGSSQFSAFLPFAEGNYGTADGKAQLYSEELARQGLDPVAEFKPPRESRHSPEAKTFPLELLARKADNFLNTSFCNVSSLQPLEETGLLEMNSADAGARGIADGSRVRVYNSRGELRLTARVDGKVQTGVVSAKLNWAKFGPEKKNINVLTSEKLTDLGNSATFYSVLVEVELVRPLS